MRIIPFAANVNVFDVPVRLDPVVPEMMPREVIEVPPLAATVKPGVACADGATTTVIKPAPRVDTATSAMRLRSVLIDILFLSLSQIRPFLIWLEEAFSSF
jgi:hypothetical protein